MWKFIALRTCFHPGRRVWEWPDCTNSRRLFLHKDSWFQRRLQTPRVTHHSVCCDSRDRSKSLRVSLCVIVCMCSHRWSCISSPPFFFFIKGLWLLNTFASIPYLSITLFSHQNASHSQTKLPPSNGGGQTDWWQPTANRPTHTDCHVKYDDHVN